MPQNALQRREGGRRTRQEHHAEAPLISVITVAFNARQELENIRSNLRELDHTQFEWIVIDGNSQDGTAEMLEASGDEVDYWLSEPDCGVYDAMNKAKAVSRGIFLFHLNAGDRLVYLPFEELTASVEERLDVAAFRVLIDGKQCFRPSTGYQLRIKNTLHHQGTFYRRETFPAYDPKYKILADFDVNQRLIRNRAKVGVFDAVVAIHSTDGLSNHAATANSEHFRVIRNNYGWHWALLSWLQRKWLGFLARMGRA